MMGNDAPFKLFIILFLAVLGFFFCCVRTLVAASRGYSLVAVCRLLISVASLIVNHRLSDTQASVAAARELSSCGF